MYNKKAQVTIFVIIGILVVAGVALFFTLKSNVQEQRHIPSGIEPIKTYVQSCLEQESEKAILLVAEGGGYLFPPSHSTEARITYYHLKGRTKIPEKQDIENRISSYIEERMFFCTKNFVDFPEYNITQRDIRAKTEIKRNHFSIDLTYPLDIQKGEIQTSLKDFEYNEEMRLGTLYYSIKDLFNQGAFDDGICLTCLHDKTQEKNLYVNMLDFEDTNRSGTVFIFEDKETKINNQTLEWMFANEY